MINLTLLAIIIVAVVIFIVFNIYFYAYYAHPGDTWFGQSLGMKIVIVSPSDSRFSASP